MRPLLLLLALALPCWAAPAPFVKPAIPPALRPGHVIRFAAWSMRAVAVERGRVRYVLASQAEAREDSMSADDWMTWNKRQGQEDW